MKKIKLFKFDNYKKKTYTSYWNNFSEKPKKFNFIKKFLKNLKIISNKLFGFQISIRIRKIDQKKDEAYISYPIESIIKRKKDLLIAEEIISFLKFSNLEYDVSKLKEYINEFDNVFFQSPVKEQGSGFGYNESIFFFTLLKIINPEIVIESGVMKGFTTYLIENATNSKCKIFSYDINFDNKIFNSKKAEYFMSDITNEIPFLENKRIVALWDDHTSQLDRLKFSQKHKIEFNFFDDDLSLLNIHSDGWPPIPTISMLKEIRNTKIDLETISWISRNRKGIAYLDSFSEEECLEKIIFHNTFPQLFPITGYKNHSQCSLVINKIT